MRLCSIFKRRGLSTKTKAASLTSFDATPDSEFIVNPQYAVSTHDKLLARFAELVVPALRVSNIARLNLLTRRNLSAMSASFLCVAGIGGYEATLLLDTAAPTEDAMQFVGYYSKANIIPSCTWATKPADVIAQAFDLSNVLKVFDESKESAELQLKVINAQVGRSVVAQITLLSQLLYMYNVVLWSNKRYTENILKGEEVLFDFGSTYERVIRLCGKASDVTAVSLSHHGKHILPIVETSTGEKNAFDLASVEQSNKDLIKTLSNGGKIPFYWQVPTGRYGSADTWKQFKVNPSFFLRSTTGKRILCLEADSTQSEDPLGISRQVPDLALEDAIQAFRRIEGIANSYPSRIIRIYLGNSQQTRQVGCGNEYTLRGRFEYLKEFDVLIDARAAVLTALFKWAQRSVTSDATKHIVLHTEDKDYFLTIKTLFARKGYIVVDPVDFSKQEKTTDDETTPHLIYESTTLNTVNMCESVITSGVAPASRCCVLIDKKEGLDILRQAKWTTEDVPKGDDETRHMFHTICSSVLFDDLFRQVRTWARLGHSAQEIQNELDSRFDAILKLEGRH